MTINNHYFQSKLLSFRGIFFSIFTVTLFLTLSACSENNSSTKTNEDENKNDIIAEADLSKYEPKKLVTIENPSWVKDAVIYELNTRHFTKEGTFNAAATHLPRLKELGIDIIWLMPIHPIGEKNRKGSMGSPYSVKDYFAVNPEFGTKEDLKSFVDKAHELGMYVILDWVANHTAWDNEMVYDHPDWYERNHKGEFRPTPWWDWSDIIDLNYDNANMREYMTSAFKYWVTNFDIDGFRCDVAGYVPLDFWENLRSELDEIKDVFMLGEWESRDLHYAAFDATYGWSWYEAMHKIATGKANSYALYDFYSKNESSFPREAIRMTFVSNHDKNAWENTMFEAFNDYLPAAITLSVIGEGMPLLYSGQEAGNAKRLAFFEKDEIIWQEHEIGDLYKKLFKVKKDTSALWNGKYGARMILVPNNHEGKVFSFVRMDDNSKVFAAFNFSAEKITTKFNDDLFIGKYSDIFADEDVTKEIVLDSESQVEIPPFGFKVYIQN